MKKLLLIVLIGALFFGCIEQEGCGNYAVGESWKEDCNTCTCTENGAACTAMGCNNINCGEHSIGESWTCDDGCNTCSCTENGVVSTLMACPSVGIANPASTYCIEQGGELELRQDENNSYGQCVFEYGECEEWAFFRGECSPNCVNSCGDGECQEVTCDAIGCPCSESAESCPEDCKASVGLANPASVNCVEKGGKLEMRKSENGTYGLCVWEGLGECEEWTYFQGECNPCGGVEYCDGGEPYFTLDIVNGSCEGIAYTGGTPCFNESA